ncbi:MAG: GNAT family N-acetyltransferase [Planctomycetota bacterium]|jgi:RimJ/RimL family protein N-acetyltransferase|nr:GNAT family N-acetyltransferase [Planctomycetota bacterium]
MELHTERLLLRQWQENDAAALFRHASDPCVGAAAGWETHRNAEYSRAAIRRFLAEGEIYAIVPQGESEPVGSIGLWLQADAECCAEMRPNDGELGYWIAKPYWGRGLMPEAVREVLRHGFADLGLDAIWCGYYAGNEQSRRVQEKCGFQYHHTETDKPTQIAGDRRTEHFSRLKKEEWRAIKN